MYLFQSEWPILKKLQNIVLQIKEMEKYSPFIIIFEGYTIYNNFSWKLSYFITLILLSYQ